MSTRRLIVIAGLILALAALVGYAYASPWLAVSKVRKAAQAGDVETINAHVDFPALRESFKAWINASMARELAKSDVRENAWSLLGLAIASKLGEVLVEAIVTPEAVRMMLDGQRPQPRPAGEAAAPIFPTAPKSSERTGESETTTEMRYESRDRFLVTFNKRADPSVTFTLVWHRSGLVGWTLAGIRMPAASK